ncbi:hypothetical protein [Candidatus Nanohalobium constans]|uniref:Uncharacterized protein n=1 Tax=Candidatus Nanohalobium constans TaxID=2565781 RepID=A0A5Q0UHF8_9ARCH|nr:hypothetical protein [Candidatus Nanohalobium constans]QGA80329.1 hypothetical protein LC1Nh_0428 [Candidatus Nanohalobium constans]
MGLNAAEVINQAEREEDQLYDDIRDVAEWFHEREGKMFERSEAEKKISSDLQFEPELVSEVLEELTSDIVDPVAQINNSQGNYIGIINYEEFDAGYVYLDYHDINGVQKKAVCATCVQNSEKDSQVKYTSSTKIQDEKNPDYTKLKEEINQHHQKHHNTKIEKIKTGATLASGTTIGGNRAATRNWVNNNADVPNADHADNAGQLEGNTTSQVQSHSPQDHGNGSHTENYASQNDLGYQLIASDGASGYIGSDDDPDVYTFDIGSGYTKRVLTFENASDIDAKLGARSPGVDSWDYVNHAEGAGTSEFFGQVDVAESGADIGPGYASFEVTEVPRPDGSISVGITRWHDEMSSGNYYITTADPTFSSSFSTLEVVVQPDPLDDGDYDFSFEAYCLR